MAKKKQEKKKKKVSYHRQPEDQTLKEWQINLRKQYGQAQEFELTNLGDHKVWSDFNVHNPVKGNNYRVAIRHTEVGHNYCDCYDFKVSGLGTCKHIEWALFKLQNTYGNKQHFKKPPPLRAYSSVYLHYGKERSLRIRIGTEKTEEYQILANKYFDDNGVFYDHAYLEFDQFLAQAKALSEDFICYNDAIEWIVERREDQRRHQRVVALQAKGDSLDGIIKAQLYPYQKEGVFFAMRAGRCLLADEMGLGKTIQAIATAEMYKQEYQIGGVYIICPTSLKYQWRAEIKKFTDSTVMVIEGPAKKRVEQYSNTQAFYKILTYNVVARDIYYLNSSQPDLIILDEAQRIKNWDTKIAQAVKKLYSPFRIALTGTPLENKIEDLYSIVQFLDQFLLGPLYLLMYRHQVKDDNGVILGYRKLDEIYNQLSGLMLRRKKKQVLKQLPPRVDKNLFVPMTPQQRSMHNGYDIDVAQLVAKWRRQNFLTEQDRLRLMSLLQLMRMSCNSTYLVDQKTRHDTKVDELFYILEEKLADPTENTVIFSQWSRMTHLIATELDERGINYTHLHGGVPSVKRGELLDRFREDDECRVFLSTDAGGLGLNLQKATFVINLDLPWNPAVLEQRIARVYRLGQENSVQVINLISEGTIEHKMLFTLAFKSSLASAVLDATESEVFMDKDRFKKFMERLDGMSTHAQPNLETLPAEQAEAEDDLERPQSANTPQEAEPSAEDFTDNWWESEETAIPEPELFTTNTATENAANNAATSQQLVNDGISFLSRLTQTLSNPAATANLVNSLVQKDEKSGQTYLKIPVESEKVVQNAMQLLGGLLGNLK